MFKKFFIAFLILLSSDIALSNGNSIYFSPEAESIPFDPLTSGLTSTEVGPAIRELASNSSITVSPGFTWGRSGNAPTGTYLLNDNVPSNVTGRVVPVSSGAIMTIFVATETVGTWVLAIQKRSGASFVEIGTVTMTAQRTKTQQVTISVTLGDELALYVKTGSCKNPVVGLIIKGST